jgi:hypothetical protein
MTGYLASFQSTHWEFEGNTTTTKRHPVGSSVHERLAMQFACAQLLVGSVSSPEQSEIIVVLFWQPWQHHLVI